MTEDRNSEAREKLGAPRDRHDARNLADPEPTVEVCVSCGRPIGWDGQPASVEGGALICGECDAARNFDVLTF